MSQPQKTALVTGSSNGIGEAVVKKLAQQDYKLVVTGRNKTDISRVASECAQLSPSKSKVSSIEYKEQMDRFMSTHSNRIDIRSDRGKPLELMADLMVEQDVDGLYRQTIEYFNGRLDLLVNNAGFSWPVEHTKADECYEAFKKVMQVNVNSAVRLTLLAAEALKETAANLCDGRPTSIVFIGSLASQRPTEGLAAYSSSKAAMSMFAKSIASELGPTVRVNCIEPGPIATKIVERAGSSLELFRAACGRKTILKRIGTSEEVAEAVAFFADDEKSGFITGAQLLIDGGALAVPLRWSD